MWNSGGMGGGNDGGFMSTQSQFASPAGQVEKKPRRQQNLIPVTLRMILNTPADEPVTVSNTELQMLTVVGVIRAVDVTSTKVTYTIDDTTGVMDAVQWLENDQDTKDSYANPMMEMTYCRIFGSIRPQHGSRYIMIFSILPIKDPNIITTHILEVIHSSLKLKQIENVQIKGSMPESNRATGTMQSSLIGTPGLDGDANTSMGSGGFSGMQGLTRQQNMVFQIIRQCVTEGGTNRDAICRQLDGKVNQNQVNQVLEFLSSEGHIYTTIDDEHFKTTDG